MAENKDYLRGVLFAMTTAVLWGFLPILMKIALRDFSSGTIVWFRFTFAFFVLLAYLAFKGQKPQSILKQPPVLGVVAGMCLAGNYFYFLRGIETSSPSNAAILIQTAPILLVLIGVFIFRERFEKKQGVGLLIACVGFTLFYADQRSQTLDFSRYTLSNAYVIWAGILWVGYMTFQKTLAGKHGAQLLNLLVYGVAGAVLVLVVQWDEFGGHGWGAWMLMVFLGINTLLAYGCLAEAIRYIPLWLISVIVTLNPFITLVTMHILPKVNPAWIEPEHIGISGYLGAVVAVTGVILVIRKSE